MNRLTRTRGHEWRRCRQWLENINHQTTVRAGGAAGSYEPWCEGRCTRAANAAKPIIVARSGFSRKRVAHAVKKGPHTVSVETKDGKIAAFHVKHDQKGELPIKKYKTNKKMAQAGSIHYASYVQVQYLGTTWIGYSYIDEFGDEEIYWYPYDMIYDGDTGAVEYIPV